MRILVIERRRVCKWMAAVSHEIWMRSTYDDISEPKPSFFEYCIYILNEINKFTK